MKTHNIIILTLFLLFSIILISCRSEEKKDPFEFKYDIINIDGCEYLQYVGAMGYKHLEHKGNCPNPVHCYNK